MQIRLLEVGPLLTIAACSHTSRPTPGAEARKEGDRRGSAQTTIVQAELLLIVAGGEQIQDHNGTPVVILAGPAIGDTGGEQLPTFSNGKPDYSYDNAGSGTMPNGGERPLQSTNSLPGPLQPN